MRDDTQTPFWHPGRAWRRVSAWLLELIDENRGELVGAAGAFIYSVLRATGVQVDTGTTAVRFTFGRAGKTLEHGFHFLIPFVQRAPKVATRARTLDLPAQRVATAEGLVHLVDTAIQFRVRDPRRALVEVEHLDRGLLTMVAMAVQSTLYDAGRDVLSDRAELELRITARLAAWTEAWGVSIERVGLTSLTPSPRTLRVTQLRQAIAERERMHARLVTPLGSERRALALLGPRALPLRRGVILRANSAATSSERRVGKRLVQEGYRRDELARARRRAARLFGKDAAATSELLAGSDPRSMRERLLAKSAKPRRRAVRSRSDD